MTLYEAPIWTQHISKSGTQCMRRFQGHMSIRMERAIWIISYEAALSLTRIIPFQLITELILNYTSVFDNSAKRECISAKKQLFRWDCNIYLERKESADKNNSSAAGAILPSWDAQNKLTYLMTLTRHGCFSEFLNRSEAKEQQGCQICSAISFLPSTQCRSANTSVSKA